MYVETNRFFFVPGRDIKQNSSKTKNGYKRDESKKKASGKKVPKGKKQNPLARGGASKARTKMGDRCH